MKFEEFVKKYGFDDVEEAKNKIKYYQEYFDCDFEGAIDMVKKQHKILGLSEEKVCAQVDFLKEAFSFETLKGVQPLHTWLSKAVFPLCLPADIWNYYNMEHRKFVFLPYSLYPYRGSPHFYNSNDFTNCEYPRFG